MPGCLTGMPPRPCCSAVARLRTLESRSNQASSSAQWRTVLFGEVVALFFKGTAPATFPQIPDLSLILVYLFCNLGAKAVTQMAGVAMETDIEQECWTLPTAERWRRGEPGARGWGAGGQPRGGYPL